MVDISILEMGDRLLLNGQEVDVLWVDLDAGLVHVVDPLGVESDVPPGELSPVPPPMARPRVKRTA